MSDTIFNRRNLLALACALAVTGCVYTPADYGSPPPSGGGVEPPPPPPPPVEQVNPSDISLSPGYFKGRDASGDRIRAQVKRDGRDFRVQSLKGKNGPERLYRDVGNNTYVASNEFSIQVTSPRSFLWSGPHGNITMND